MRLLLLFLLILILPYIHLLPICIHFNIVMPALHSQTEKGTSRDRIRREMKRRRWKRRRWWSRCKRRGVEVVGGDRVTAGASRRQEERRDGRGDEREGPNNTTNVIDPLPPPINFLLHFLLLFLRFYFLLLFLFFFLHLFHWSTGVCLLSLPSASTSTLSGGRRGVALKV